MSDEQARDELGRWTSEGASALSKAAEAASDRARAKSEALGLRTSKVSTDRDAHRDAIEAHREAGRAHDAARREWNKAPPGMFGKAKAADHATASKQHDQVQQEHLTAITNNATMQKAGLKAMARPKAPRAKKEKAPKGDHTISPGMHAQMMTEKARSESSTAKEHTAANDRLPGAMKHDDKSDHRRAADAHEVAAAAHKDAAKAAREKGDERTAAQHDRMVYAHQNTAHEHREQGKGDFGKGVSSKQEALPYFSHTEKGAAAERAGNIAEHASSRTSIKGIPKSETHGEAAKAHNEASRAHLAAAESARSMGQSLMALQHERLAEHHRDKADDHARTAKSEGEHEARLKALHDREAGEKKAAREAAKAGGLRSWARR